jgi:hypothetical protein
MASKWLIHIFGRSKNSYIADFALQVRRKNENVRHRFLISRSRHCECTKFIRNKTIRQGAWHWVIVTTSSFIPLKYFALCEKHQRILFSRSSIKRTWCSYFIEYVDVHSYSRWKVQYRRFLAKYLVEFEAILEAALIPFWGGRTLIWEDYIDRPPHPFTECEGCVQCVKFSGKKHDNVIMITW